MGRGVLLMVYLGFFLIVGMFVAFICYDINRNRQTVTIRTIVNVKDTWLYDEYEIIPAYIRREGGEYVER